MRLSGKLIFALTLALTLLAPSACATIRNDMKFDFLLDGIDTTKITWNTQMITFKNEDARTDFLKAIGNGVSKPKDFAVTFTPPATNANIIEYKATLANGAKVSLKQSPLNVDDLTQVTLSLSTVNSGTVKPTFSKSPIIITEINKANGVLTFTKADVSDIYQLRSFPDGGGAHTANTRLIAELDTIYSILTQGGFYNHHFASGDPDKTPILVLAQPVVPVVPGVPARPVVPLLATDGVTYCCRLSDEREFCVNHFNDTDITVTIKPAPVSVWNTVLMGWFAPPGIVLVTAAIGGFIASHILCFLDPIGYQAGKDASSLPELVKYVLPDAEGFDSEGGVSDGDDSSLRIDPSSGKRVRTTREGRVLTGEDDPEPIEDETTDAFGVSVTAALLLVPFLL